MEIVLWFMMHPPNRDNIAPETEVEAVTRLLEEARWFLRPGKQGPPKTMENLTFSQARCLFTITMHENCTLRELGGYLGVRPSTASEIVDRLVRANLVQRVTDAEDRRSVRLNLTRKGRNIHTRHREMQREQSQFLWEKLTEEQRADLKQALTVLTATMRQIDGEPWS